MILEYITNRVLEDYVDFPAFSRWQMSSELLWFIVELWA